MLAFIANSKQSVLCLVAHRSPSVPHAGCDSVNGDNGPREDVNGAKVVRTSLATAAVHATSRHRFGQARPRKVPAPSRHRPYRCGSCRC